MPSMISLRRLCLSILVAVIAMTAFAAAPSVASAPGEVAFGKHCECSDMCGGDATTCSTMSGCTAVCASIIFGDFAASPIIQGVRTHATLAPAGALIAIDRPPPLGPPRA